jgi:hypothetical protein
MNDAPTLDPNTTLQILRAGAINSYASVEQALCRLFGMLLGTDLQLGAIVFYRITNTHSRNQILDDLLTKRHGTTYDAYWHGVAGLPNRKATGMWSIIRQLDQARNEIVHWHVGFRLGSDNSTAIPALTKPDVWPIIHNPDKRVISHQELTEFIYKADFIHRSMNIFFGVLSGQIPPPAGKSLREIFERPAFYPPEDTNPLSRNHKAPESPPQPSEG